MSTVAVLKLNAVGRRTIITDRGEYLHFINGVCTITEDMATETLRDWLEKQAKGYGISAMTDEEMAERAEAEAQQAARDAKKVEGQNLVNAILSGRDPELIEAKTPAEQVAAGSSVQQRIAEAKALAAAKR